MPPKRVHSQFKFSSGSQFIVEESVDETTNGLLLMFMEGSATISCRFVVISANSMLVLPIRYCWIFYCLSLLLYMKNIVIFVFFPCCRSCFAGFSWFFFPSYCYWWLFATNFWRIWSNHLLLLLWTWMSTAEVYVEWCLEVCS